MKLFKSTLTALTTAILSTFVLHPTISFAQGGGGSYMTPQQRTVIIDSILSGDLKRIRNLARRQPKLAPAIAALHCKHSGAKGRAAGEAAAAIATATDSDTSQGCDIVASVAKNTTASLAELAEITDEVANATGLKTSVDTYAPFVGCIAQKLGLRGQQAGAFAAIIIENEGYRGAEAGQFAGIVTRDSEQTEPEAEQILGEVLNTLNPEPEEAEQIASALELETGVKIAVVRESGDEQEVAAARVREDKAVINPLDILVADILEDIGNRDRVISPDQ